MDPRRLEVVSKPKNCSGNPLSRKVWKSVLKPPLAFSLLAGVLLSALPAAAQKHYKQLRYPPLGDLRLPPVERTVLPNGLVLYLVEDPSLPRVEGHVLIRTGARFEPAEKVGLTSILGQAMRTGGSTTRKGEEIDRQLENVGASVETSIGTSAATASLFTLQENLPQVLDILADLLRNPAFPEDKIELAKVQERTAIARRNDDVGSIADREFSKLLYGAASPYARTTEYGTIEVITRDELVAFHRCSFHPNQTILGLWGDFHAAEAKALVERFFGNWPRQEVAMPALPAVPQEGQGSVNFIAKEDVNQTNLRIGHLGGRFDDPDYYALDVMAEILGGGLSSRLFRHIRSDLGLAYAVGAAWRAGFDYPGSFVLRCDTKSQTTVQATEEILKEFGRLTQEPVTADELRVAKEGILNSFVFNFDNTGEVVRRLMTYEYYGYPRDFLEKFKANVERVTAADVLRAAQKHLKSAKLVILAVGRQQDFDQPLSSLGEVTDIDVSIPPPPVHEDPLPAPTPASEAKARVVVEAAIRGMGGLDALQAIRDVSYLMQITQVTPQGELTLTSKASILLPDKFRQDVVAPFGEISLIYDGQRAWQKTVEGVEEMPSAQVENIRKRLARNLGILLLDAHAGHRALQFLETTVREGREVNSLLVTDARGDRVTVYVEQSTGRIVKESFQGHSPFAGPVQEEQIFSDFRSVGSITVPFKTLILQNGEKSSEATVVNYEVNTGLDPGLFARPEGK
jgi:predicted Zn-dependent peptidase